MSTTLTIVIGCLFVVIGRWLFTHLQKLAPASLGGHSVAVNDLGRIIGISLTFVGASAALFAVSGPFLPGVFEAPLVLGAAAVLTWLTFRSKTKRDSR